MRRLFALLVLTGAAPALAQPYTLTTVADGLRAPWCVAFDGRGGFLVTEQAGALKRIAADGRVRDIEAVPAVYYKSQGGLFDVLPAPDFGASGTLYLSYAEGPPGDNATALARARLDGERLVDVRVIHRVTPRKDTPVHYGGRIAWLADGTLLLTTGDGFDLREAAQDRASGLGKTLRLRADGTPVADPPFPDAPFVFSYGHRNPQGLAVAADGTIWQHEHGPRGGDEINVLKAGANYGWPAVTTGVDYNGALVSPYTEWPGMTSPLHQWSPSIAPSGLAIYEGDLFPAWRGDLFVGALVAREVRRVRIRDGQVVEEASLFAELGARVRDVRVGPGGALYLLTNEDNSRLVRVTPVARVGGALAPIPAVWEGLQPR